MPDLIVEPMALTLADLRRFGDDQKVCLSEETRRRVGASNRRLLELVGNEAVIYGVNTGFGPMSATRIAPEKYSDLQRRVVLSSAAGTGAPLSVSVVRRAILLKLATFAVGASGVTENLADALVFLLNADITPVVPSKGSVGASGDLAPLAHIGAAVIGEGDVIHRGVRRTAREAFAREQREPLALQAKEGLALVNGTQISTALAIEGLFALEDLFRAMLPIAALSVEAGSGSASAFDDRIQRLRGQVGQARVAAYMRDILAGSSAQLDRAVSRVQDPYCLRCIPQVMGAVLDQMCSAGEILRREVNGVSDNPLIDTETGDVLYGGNFHAQPIGMAADDLALAFSEMGSMSERRIAFLVDSNLSGLPAFLAREGGLNSGFMVAQVTAAALASENKMLSNPASTDSIPTAANLEDYVSMATFAARRLGDLAENLRAILAIELLAAAQGLDLRRPARSSPLLENVFALLRQRVSFWEDDRFFAPDLAAAVDLIAGGVPGVGVELPSSR